MGSQEAIRGIEVHSQVRVKSLKVGSRSKQEMGMAFKSEKQDGPKIEKQEMGVAF